MTLVITLALLSAACYGVAAVLQHQAAATQAPELSMRFGLLLQLIRHPRWLLGNLVDVAGFAFQLFALRDGPLTLVEPLLVASLVFAFPVSAWLGHRRVSGAETMSAVVVAGGLGLFLAVARPATGHPQASVVALVIMTVAVATLVAAAVLTAWKAARNATGLLLAAAAGLAFGFMAAATSLSWQELSHGALVALTSWAPYGVLVSGLGGVLLTQSAFNSGRLRLSLPMMTVVQPIAAIVIGIFVFGEQIATRGISPLLEVLGLAVMVGGVFTLARPEFPE
ncbi:MAG: DMT family transporter [Acidimicrobiales bacterium]